MERAVLATRIMEDVVFGRIIIDGQFIGTFRAIRDFAFEVQEMSAERIGVVCAEEISGVAACPAPGSRYAELQ